MADLTDAFRPWMSDTTAMIDVTATMLPSTVMNDRSFAVQMASSAMLAASRNLFITKLQALAFDSWLLQLLSQKPRVKSQKPKASSGHFQLDEIAVDHPAH